MNEEIWYIIILSVKPD